MGGKKVISLVVMGLAGMVLVGCSTTDEASSEEDVESFDVEFNNNAEFEEDDVNLSDVEKEEADHAASLAEKSSSTE